MNTVTKLRMLIVDARILRGLSPARPASTDRVPCGRRNRLLARARYLARTHGLQPWVDDFVAASDASTVTGLDPEGLEAPVGWLERSVEDMHSACDWGDAPPAR